MKKILFIFLLISNFVFAQTDPLPSFEEENIPALNEDLKKNLENLPEQRSDMDMGTHKVTNVTDPSAAQDAATKNYVDSNQKIVQVVNVITSTVATGTTLLPFDNTIPQDNEGDQYMSLAITPTSATNILFIEVVIFLSHSANLNLSAALFSDQDGTADAIAAMGTSIHAVDYHGNIKFNHYMTAGTTSATTFTVRAGANVGATTTFNGVSGVVRFGGKMASSITIFEIAS